MKNGIKRITKITAVLVLIMIAAFSAIPAGAAEYEKAVITASGVNVREGAGYNYKVIDNIADKGTKVWLLSSKKYNTYWYHIKLKSGTKGYVHMDYIKIPQKELHLESSLIFYRGYPESCNIVNTTGKTAVFSVSDESIAAVDKKGIVTPLKKGKTTLKATAGSYSTSSTITVKNASVKLNMAEVTIYSDETLALTATCAKPVIFTSSDENVASVSSEGVVTPKGPGTVEITAASNSGKAHCAVTIKEREIVLSTDRSKFYTGCYAKLTASGGFKTFSYESSDPSVLTVDKHGYVYGVKAGSAKIVCKSGSLSKSKKFTVTAGSEVKLSSYSATVKSGMTYYAKPHTKNLTWKSQDEDVATVDGGFITARKKGMAVIRAYTDSGERDFLITVTSAEPVRFVYTSENSAHINTKVTFYAITDTSRTDVKFKITDPEGNKSWLKSPSKKTSDNRYIWSKAKKLTLSGVYTIEAYSHTKTGKWSTSGGGKATTFITDVTSNGQAGYSERRASTAIIRDIAGEEGFLPYVTPDPLVTDAPTVGYGRVVYANTTFYNGMTQDEAFAFLVKTVNDSAFTGQLNKILTENKMKFNQYQFDALMSFAYNLGAYAIQNHEDILGALQNSFGKASNEKKAYIKKNNVYIHTKPSDSSAELKYIKGGTYVKLVTGEEEKGWYKIRSGDSEGYVKKSQIVRLTASDKVRNLRNVDFKTFSQAVMDLHHAGGVCYYGLLYRRIDEIELFYFGDYNFNGRDNAYGMSYTCYKTGGISLNAG